MEKKLVIEVRPDHMGGPERKLTQQCKDEEMDRRPELTKQGACQERNPGSELDRWPTVTMDPARVVEEDRSCTALRQPHTDRSP